MNFDKERMSVLVLEPASTVRQMIVDVLKDLGFCNINAVAKGKDALHFMEVDHVDWFISSSMVHDTVNIIHLLEIAVREPRLRHIRISLLIEPDSEEYILLLAFELGLFSWHRKSYIKESIVNEMEDLISLFNLKGKDDVLVAAEYLRNYLNESKGYRNRLVFEQNMISFYPGSSQCLLSLAEAQFLSERYKESLATLQQVEIIKPQLGALCDRLRKKIELTDSEDIGVLKKSNCLSLKKCILIDSDTDYLYNIKELLEKIGVQDIEVFEDGETAFAFLKQEPEPSLIFMEWRVPGVTGPVLAQRIRNHGFMSVPIILVSSLVQKKDMNLIKEMGIDGLIEKPFEAEKFYSVIIWCIQQNNKPSEQKSYELKITRLLDKNKKEEAERLIYDYLKDSRISNLDKISIQAILRYNEGKYQDVESMCLIVLSKQSRNLKILNLLGKTYLKLGQFDKGLVCLEKAKELSPDNIERLITIADVNNRLGNEQEAEKNTDLARDIDPDSELVKRSDCKKALEDGDETLSKKLFSELDHLKNVVSDMNNTAIALARNGRYEEGIKLYKVAVNSFASDQIELKAIVQYNLSMAYARYGDLQTSLDVLKKIEGSDKFSIDRKIKSLHAKINLCLKEGGGLAFNTDENKVRTPAIVGESEDEKSISPPEDQKNGIEGNEDQSDDKTSEDEEAVYSSLENLNKNTAKTIESLNQTLQLQKGDICCHLLFFDIQGLCMESETLRENPPHFKLRDTISKAS